MQDSDIENQHPSHPYNRGVRIGLLVLLIATVSFAGGALFVKYKLELLRTTVELRAESRTGARLQVGSVQVNGLRGLRVDNFEAVLDTMGPMLRMSVPVALVDIDIIDLLSGEVTVDCVRLDNAIVSIARPPDGEWFTTETLAYREASSFLGAIPFRVIGKDGTLDIQNVVGATRVGLDDFQFDFSRLSGSSDIAAKLSAELDGMGDKEVEVNLRFTSLEDFDLRIQCASITADDINVLLPASQRLVETGMIRPSVRVTGYPNRTLVLSCEAQFANMTIRDQPSFLKPATGDLTALASYNIAEGVLSLTAAKAKTSQLAGALEGWISLAEELPSFDLRLGASQFPVLAVLNSALQGQVADRAILDLELHEACEVEVRLQGTSETPQISGEISVNAGTLAFTPKKPYHPRGALELGLMKVSWSSESSSPAGMFNVSGGTLEHGRSGFRADKISGVVNLKEGKMVCDPFNAEITGNPFVGRLGYDVATGRGELVLDGKINGLEKTLLAEAHKDVIVSGAVDLNCRIANKGEGYVLDGEFDATQAQLDYRWWFRKPLGIGATATKVHAEWIPRKALTFSGDLSVMSSPVAVTGSAVWTDGAWRVDSLDSHSEAVELAALDKCLRIPYSITGGTGTQAHYSWRRHEGTDRGAHIELRGLVDEAKLTPADSEIPLHFKGLNIDVRMETGTGQRTGKMVLAVDSGRMPPFGSPWFIPLNTDPEMQKKYPDAGWNWTYDLSAPSLKIPPLEGIEFQGSGLWRTPDVRRDSVCRKP